MLNEKPGKRKQGFFPSIGKMRDDHCYSKDKNVEKGILLELVVKLLP